MRRRLLIVLMSITMLGYLSAQELVLPELQGYKKVLNYPVYGPDKLWDFINGAADMYLAYGFVDLHIAEYKKGKNVIKLEVYRHSNNTMAFGIYSSERSPSFRFINLGAQGYETGGAINFFKGEYYVKIRTFSKSEKTLQAAKSLAQSVSGMLKGESKMPAALAQFPETGKKPNEEIYINESVLGHKFLNKAYKANYEIGPDIFSVFILENKTPEEATNTVDTFLKSAGMDPVGSGSGKYMLTDGYNGTIFLAWKDNQVVIISGLSKDQSDIADNYTSEIIK
jgi:hypothetical protein